MSESDERTSGADKKGGLFARLRRKNRDEHPNPTGADEDRPQATVPAPAINSEGGRGGFFSKLRARLKGSDAWLTEGLGDLEISGRIDETLMEELETRMLMADMGVEATREIMTKLQDRIAAGKVRNGRHLIRALREDMGAILAPCSQPLDLSKGQRPYVLLMVGVNGVGKTTTIGKLARRFKDQGLSVMLAAGDTFRAAAVEQLQTWGERNDVPVIAQGKGADPASVIFDAVQSAQARGVDVLIADTAGRLHTQGHLMEELGKIRRVIQKHDPSAPHEIMLVVDATTGQNALNQALQFNEAVNLSGITITKLDGTARGGIIFAIAKRLALPIRFIGVGEKVEDLGVFNADEFINALFTSGQ